MWECFLHCLSLCDGLWHCSHWLQVMERKADILSLASSRKTLLEDSLKLQQTLRDVDDVMAWANEKLKTASDESFRVSSSDRGVGVVIM